MAGLKRALALVLAGALCVGLSACKSKPAAVQCTVLAMDTVMTLTVYADQSEGEEALDAMAAKTQGNVSVVGSPFGNRQKNERTLSDEDVELLLDLGYDANLTQKVGGQRVTGLRFVPGTTVRTAQTPQYRHQSVSIG